MLRALILIVTVATINVSAAADYDVLIRNGSIYDGTGALMFWSNITNSIITLFPIDKCPAIPT